MHRSIPLFVGCLLIAVCSTSAIALEPPRPGTTNSGLNESEEATLWSNLPANHWDSKPNESTAIHEIADETDLTFTEPPSTASRWNEYAHETFQAGNSKISVYPKGAETTSNAHIKDAHATIFAVNPSTRMYISPDDERHYVAPNGQLYGAVDYRVELPDTTTRNNRTRSWELLDHHIEDVRLYVDDEEVNRLDGTTKPVFDYILNSGHHTLTLEAQIEATVQETVQTSGGGNLSTQTRTETTSIVVENSISVDVYDFDPTVVSVEYPTGEQGVSLTHALPWQGYTLDSEGEQEIRGVWRFFTAQSPEWASVVQSTADSTTSIESDALPVYVYAYPSALAPKADPAYGGPTLLRSWGASNESPKESLPKHVSVEVVEEEYDETYGMAVKAEQIDSNDVTAHGIVYNTETDLRPLFDESREIYRSSLTASIITRNESHVTVLLELEHSKTGDPIQLSENVSSPGVMRIQAGHIEIAGQRIQTNASGQATVTLSDPGVYSARFIPAPWMNVRPAYSGDTATVRWHQMTTPMSWVNAGIRLGMYVLPFVIAWYAGREFAKIFRVGGHR